MVVFTGPDTAYCMTAGQKAYSEDVTKSEGPDADLDWPMEREPPAKVIEGTVARTGYRVASSSSPSLAMVERPLSRTNTANDAMNNAAKIVRMLSVTGRGRAGVMENVAPSAAATVYTQCSSITYVIFASFP